MRLTPAGIKTSPNVWHEQQQQQQQQQQWHHSRDAGVPAGGKRRRHRRPRMCAPHGVDPAKQVPSRALTCEKVLMLLVLDWL